MTARELAARTLELVQNQRLFEALRELLARSDDDALAALRKGVDVEGPSEVLRNNERVRDWFRRAAELGKIKKDIFND